MISPEYPPVTIGGGGIVYKNLSLQLKSKGHSVNVLAGNHANKSFLGKIKNFSDSNVNVDFVPLIPFPNFKGTNSATYTPPTLGGFLHIMKQIIQRKDAVIHLHGFCHPLIDMTAFACVLLRKKYLLTCHGIPKNPAKSGFIAKTFFNLYLATIERSVVKKASALTTVSAQLKRECQSKRLTNKKMMVIHNGENVQLRHAPKSMLDLVEEKYGLRGKQVVFAVGRLSENKGFQFLIQAMQDVTSELSNAVAVIAGIGPYEAQLRQLIARKGLAKHVKLAGWVSEEEKAALYERSDIVVFPSMDEPFGIVILEAFRMRKPLIAFNTESAREIIQDESALLVPTGDANRLAEGIIRVLTNSELRSQLVANAEKVKVSSWDNITSQYLEAYMTSNNSESHLHAAKSSLR
ncbi:MAG: glycosyltransferase family 4 protein [Candidatus Bathyarchaeota archaeon]|nr:glycosyltransferase family 4 protein [Candidatus Bathyarchaeota archaeon]